MRILVTGHKGVIGRELMDLIGKEEHTILGLDKKAGFNLYSEYLDNIKEFDPEIVIHLAASFERSYEESGFFKTNHEDNIVAGARLNRALSECKSMQSYVFASSYLVYDKTQYMYDSPWVPFYLSEESKVSPRNLCGWSKLYLEEEMRFMEKANRSGCKFVQARIFRVYGRGCQSFITRSIKNALDGFPTQVFNEDSSFDFIHARDVASALWFLAKSKASGVYNVGTGLSTPVKDLVRLFGNDSVSLKLSYKEPYENSCANIDKIKKLGWAPMIPVSAGIMDVRQYEQNIRTAE